MILKSFSHITRHAALTKTLFTTNSSSTTQPSFFVTTNQLARQQSQLATRNNSAFSKSDPSSSANPHSYSALCNTSSFSTLSPLVTLDDDKRKEAILAESTGSNGSFMIHKQQHTVPLNSNPSNPPKARRNSFDDLTYIKYQRRRYSVSKKPDLSHKATRRPTAPPSSPVTGPVNDEVDIVLAQSSLLELEREVEMAESVPEESEQVSLDSSEKEKQFIDSSDLQNNAVIADKQSLQEVNETSTQQSRSSPTFPNVSNQKFSTPVSDQPDIVSPTTNPTLTEIDPAYVQTQNTLLTELQAAINNASIPHVFEIFNNFQQQNVEPPVKAYEIMLEFLAKNISLDNYNPENLSNVLAVYTDCISKQVSPSSSIYKSVIVSLTTLAEHVASHKERNIAYTRLQKRHGKNFLPSVKSDLHSGDTSASLYRTAIDIFEASNAAKIQKFSVDVYQSVLDASNATGKYQILYKIIKMMEENNCTLNADIFISLIKGYGKFGDTTAFVETFKHYKALALSLPNLKEYEVYRALIGAYFDSGNPDSGIEFFSKVVSEDPKNENLAYLMSEIISGFSRTGDVDSALDWIQRARKEEQLSQIELLSFAQIFSTVTDASRVKHARTLFDAIASRKDAVDNRVMDITRNDFLALCIKSNDSESFYKVIKETFFRNGVWELTNVVNATRYLLMLGDVNFAIQVFNRQSERYLKHMKESELSVGDQITEAFSFVVKDLKRISQFNINTAFFLMKSPCFTSTLLSDTSASGIDCLRMIWTSNNNGSLKSLLSDVPVAITDIVNVHVDWIKFSGANNSLGGLAIPTSLLEELRANFGGLIREFVAITPPHDEVFRTKVLEALHSLNDTETLNYWTEYCNTLNSSNLPPTPPELPKLEVDIQSTNKIILDAQNINTLQSAYDELKAAIIRHDIIAPEAFVAVIDSALNNSNDHHLIHEIYQTALNLIPPPNEHPFFYNFWVQAHRSIVRTAGVDYAVAQAAYDHLLSIGTFPDATGYGQLIANAPAVENHDEASGALFLFDQARTNNVPMNTFLYNVLLSKLSKARRLKDAIFFFSDMNVTNTKKSNVTYGTMISACCRCGDETLAKALFKEMESSAHYTPKIAPFNILLQFYVHHKKDRKSALEIYEKIRDIGLKPSVHTYKLLIDAYSTINPIDIESAEKVLLTIVNDNNSITTKHYASLLYARGVCLNDLVSAQQFYNALTSYNRVRPDKNIFQALLESYVVNNQVRATPNVLRDMISYGVDLDTNMTNILIRGWAPISIEKARGLFDHLISSGVAEPSSYESIIRAYLYYGEVAKAQDVLGLMASHLYPEPVLAKLQVLIDSFVAGSIPANKKDLLLEGLFRQDSYPLVGWNKRELEGGLEDTELVKSHPSLVEY